MSTADFLWLAAWIALWITVSVTMAFRSARGRGLECAIREAERRGRSIIAGERWLQENADEWMIDMEGEQYERVGGLRVRR